MLPALGLSTITAGYGLLKALEKRAAANADKTDGTGQNVPASQSRPAKFDLSKVFDSMDKDGDDKVSKSEFMEAVKHRSGKGEALGALIALQAGTSGAAPSPATATSAATDTGTTGSTTDAATAMIAPSDPAVTNPIKTAQTNPLFDKLDANKDGKVSKEEIAAALASMKGARHGHHGKGAKEGTGDAALDALFAMIDGNKDGMVDKDELTSAMSKAADDRGRGVNPGAFASAAAQYAKTAAAAPTSSSAVAAPAA
jgi:Ca2+-binding EF-hand superfamily protein